MLALLKVLFLSLPQSRRYRVVFYKIHIKRYILSLAHALTFLCSCTASLAFHRSTPRPDLHRDSFSAAWLTKIIIYEIRTSISVQLQLESALSLGMQRAPKTGEIPNQTMDLPCGFCFECFLPSQKE